jgi:hypothetical protein
MFMSVNLRPVEEKSISGRTGLTWRPPTHWTGGIGPFAYLLQVFFGK